MIQATTSDLVPTGRLRDVLIGHLLAAPVPVMPGCEGMLVEDALRCYRRAARFGLVPGRDELVALEPGLREQIVAFFLGQV